MLFQPVGILPPDACPALHPMQRLSYAKGKSDAVAKLDGTYQGDQKPTRVAKNKAARGVP